MLHIQFLIVGASSHYRSVSPSTILTSRVFASCFLKIHPSSTELQHSPLLSASNYCQFLPFLSDPVLSPCPCSVHSGLSSDSWITWAPPAALRALSLHSLCQKNRQMDMSVYKHWNNTHTLNSHSTAKLITSELRSQSTARRMTIPMSLQTIAT